MWPLTAIKAPLRGLLYRRLRVNLKILLVQYWYYGKATIVGTDLNRRKLLYNQSLKILVNRPTLHVNWILKCIYTYYIIHQSAYNRIYGTDRTYVSVVLLMRFRTIPLKSLGALLLINLLSNIWWTVICRIRLLLELFHTKDSIFNAVWLIMSFQNIF